MVEDDRFFLVMPSCPAAIFKQPLNVIFASQSIYFEVKFFLFASVILEACIFLALSIVARPSSLRFRAALSFQGW